MTAAEKAAIRKRLRKLFVFTDPEVSGLKSDILVAHSLSGPYPTMSVAKRAWGKAISEVLDDE